MGMFLSIYLLKIIKYVPIVIVMCNKLTTINRSVLLPCFFLLNMSSFSFKLEGGGGRGWDLRLHLWWHVPEIAAE